MNVGGGALAIMSFLDDNEIERIFKVNADRCREKYPNYSEANARKTIARARTRGFVWIEELIEIAERQASSELYGLLKRPDEKFVTERAYDNPKFVEDMVRDVAAELNADSRIEWYVVESENFESIHNHSAYALIERDKTKS